MSRPDAQWEDAHETTVPDVPVHAAPLTRRRRLRRSRAFMTAFVLLCVIVAAVAAAAIVSSFHNPTVSSAGPRAASTPKISSSEVSRVQKATETAESATTTARSTLDAITGIPTPTNVAAIINPYVTSLQRYETTLSGATVPASARTGVDGIRSLVGQDVQFLSTINGLPSLSLGTYLAELGKRLTQLQTTFSEVQGKLRAAAS
jgi:hypothetical protein